MVLALTLPTDEGEVPIVIAARFEGENTLKGEWFVPETDRAAEWSATRVRKKPSAAKPAPKKPVGEKPAPEKKGVPVSFAGTWKAAAVLDDDTKVGFTLKLTGKGSELRGEVIGRTPGGVEFKDMLRDLKVDGRRISFAFEVDTGDGTVRVKMVGEVGADGTVEGRWEAGDESQGKWGATRRKARAIRL